MKLTLALLTFFLFVPSSFAFPTGSWDCYPPSSRKNKWTFSIAKASLGSNTVPFVRVVKTDENGETETLEGLGSVATKMNGDIVVAVAQGTGVFPFADITFEQTGAIKGNSDLLICD